jgi:Protein of unknown function (DUF3489)
VPTAFQIDRDDTVRVADQGVEPAKLEHVFATFEQLERLSANWPLRRLVAVWNQLPGKQRISRFENRTIGLQRIWRALNASGGEGQPAPRRRQRRVRGRQNKTELVLNMVRSPNGATLKALMKATRWQAHTVRGFLSRKVSKSLGLRVDSFRRDGERVYAIQSAQYLVAES